MKDQVSPSSAEIVSESVEQVEQNLAKKVDPGDVSVTVDSDDDSGFLNASNGSLNTCETDVAAAKEPSEPIDEEEDIPFWRLKIPPKPDSMTDEEMAKFLSSLMEEVDKIPVDARKKYVMERMTEAYGQLLPRTLLEILTAFVFDGDTGISMDIRPEWLDMEKFRRGQKFARDNLFGIFYSELLALFMVYSFEYGLKSLLVTEKSSTPYESFKRYLSTASRFQNWYVHDPWTPGNPGYEDMRAVRRIHTLVRKKLDSTSDEELEEKSKIKDAWCPALNLTRRDFQSTCPAPAPNQCPYTIVSKYPSLRHKALNQCEMVSTQFAFVSLVVLHPKAFGLDRTTDEELEAYCHVWRGLGYLLGVDDDFNFCRGSLEDVKARSSDFIEFWVKPNFRDVKPEWEHVLRCMLEGMQYYFPGSSYETCLLDLAEILDLHMPRFYSTMSYTTLIKHKVIKMVFNHSDKIPGLRGFLNYRLIQAMDRARKFDEKKHEELQERSAKTMKSRAVGSQADATSLSECLE